jgi:DNA-directed RNA polymerase specialized sigma24 family protein
LASAGGRGTHALAEAFAQALRRGDRLTDPLAWIWRIAFRVAAGELKRRARMDHRLPDVAAEAEQSERANSCLCFVGSPLGSGPRSSLPR